MRTSSKPSARFQHALYQQVLYERLGTRRRAVHYMQQVREHAARRNAPYEAVAIFSKGIELLDPVYTRFTEGFATLDLQEAKALLDVC